MSVSTVQRSAEFVFVHHRGVAAGTVSNLEPYMLACRFFRCGLIDRTRTLETGFAYDVLDPLDAILDGPHSSEPFDRLCELRAIELVAEARQSNRQLQVLWSGGIDSTVALASLIRECRRQRCCEMLRVMMSVDSVNEYPRFFQEHIWGQLEIVPIACPISSHLSHDNLVVTGEHGDQLFGSDHLQEFVENGIAFLPWPEMLPLILLHKGLSLSEAETVTRYLEPLIAACPIPVDSVFDLFWWLNFALKWQTVSLRIVADAAHEAAGLQQVMRHFFQTPQFQRWSIFDHRRECFDSWAQYKMPAKNCLYQFTKDAVYREQKEKERSLRLIFGPGEAWELEQANAVPLDGRPARPDVITLDSRFVPTFAESV